MRWAKPILLWGLLPLTLAFELFDQDNPANVWLLGNDDGYMITPAWHVEQITDHIVIIALSFFAFQKEKVFKEEFFLFFLIQVLDGVDYVFTNNSPWFSLFGITFSTNVLGIFVLGFFILTRIATEKWNMRGTKY